MDDGWMYPPIEINRKGRNFGFCRKFEVKILQKDFCFLFHFGRKEIFCRKSQFLPKSCHFGRNKPPVWCPKYCYFCRKEPLSAEIVPFGRKSFFLLISAFGRKFTQKIFLFWFWPKVFRLISSSFPPICQDSAQILSKFWLQFFDLMAPPLVASVITLRH